MQRWFHETKGPLTQRVVQALRSRVGDNRSALPPFRLPQVAQQLVAGLEQQLAGADVEAIVDLGERLADQGLGLRSLLAVHRTVARDGGPTDAAERGGWLARVDEFFDALFAGMSRWEVHDLHRQRDEMQAAVTRAVERREGELRRVISELSTPVVPVFDRILVLPLVGTIDSDRAAAITERLLDETVRRKARILIVDITGVAAVDAEIAALIVGAARAVQLLGARAVLVGIRPELAAVLTDSAIDLGDLPTLANLQSGIEWALRQRGLAVTPRSRPHGH